VSHAVCSLHTSGHGAALAAVRLVHARGESSWTAPPIRGEATLTPQEVRRHIDDAGRWCAEQLRTLPGDPALTLVLDLDGARCGWITAAGSDEAGVSAAIAEARNPPPDVDSPRAGLDWLDQAQPGLDSSALALATPHARPRRRRDPPPRPERLGLMLVPDLTARLFIDALDRHGVRPYAVLTMWHALPLAWEPGAAEAAFAPTRPAAPAPSRPGTPSDAGDARQVVADTPNPVHACLMVEPAGRLVWTWSSGGSLLCSGTVRLRRSVAEPVTSAARADAGALMLGEGGANGSPGRGPGQFGPEAVGAGGEPIALVEITRSDIGRVVNDWLSWSLELGAAPDRITCIGPSTLTCAGLEEDLPGVPAIAAAAHALARSWPGATTLPRVEDDPHLATLRALVVGLNDLAPSDRSTGASPDPRINVPDLMRRPGSASRSAYLWQGALALAGAAALAMVGYRLQMGAEELTARAEEQSREQREAIDRVKRYIPPLAANPDLPADTVIDQLEAELRRLKGEGPVIVPERPIIAELSRILTAAESPTGENRVELERITLTTRGLSQVVLRVYDAAAGSLFERRLKDLPAVGARLNWTGQLDTQNEVRRYTLRPPLTNPWIEPPAGARPGTAAPLTPRPSPPGPRPGTPSAPPPAPAPEVEPIVKPEAFPPPKPEGPDHGTTPPKDPEEHPSR
jgi:hypothetical protein